MTINLDNITLTDEELERIALRVEHFPPDEAHARYNALVNAAKVAKITGENKLRKR